MYKPRNPLKVVKYKNNFPGEDWPLAFNMGLDNEDGYQYAVCTNHVNGSMLDMNTVEEQAKIFAASNLMLNFIVNNLNKFDNDQLYIVKKILDLLEGDDLVDDGNGAKRVNYMSLFDDMKGDDE